MRKRLGEFALSLHPEKTRLIEFGRFAAERRKRRRLGKPETFNFVGFTFVCGRSRSGKFQIQRKTRRDRMLAKLRKIKETLRRCMHRPIPEQGNAALRMTAHRFTSLPAKPLEPLEIAGVRAILLLMAFCRCFPQQRDTNEDTIIWPAAFAPPNWKAVARA